MRKLSKILALVLVLMMAFAVISAFSFTSSAANIPAGTVLYLVPSANWNQSNARFAAYFFGNGEAWVSMTKVAGESNLYEVTVPAGSWTNVIFCRMNPSASANNWNNKWNQTSDLTYNGTSNCYTVKEGTWDKGGGTWSTYGSACAHTNVGAAATCTKDQLCLDCGDPVASALGHTYNSAHLCTRCNEQAAFTVAGSGAHLGTEWDTGNTANDMTYADGVYTKVYTNVAAGSYAFKVVRDHDWGTAYPSADKAYTVSTAGSTVTITLKGTAVTVTVEAPHVHSWSDVTCTEASKCSCGETQGEALGHDMVAGEVVAPTYESQGYTVYTCANGCGTTENRDYVDALVSAITGSGTEEDPYLITTLEGLVEFRDSVNAGETKYNAEGIYVALGADIDMSSVDWSVNIGDDCNATFDGIFDGKNHKLSNLNATETAKKSDGYVCGGLFGAIYGNAVIKNLVIENVSINTGDFTGNNVAAVVGFSYAGTGSIENVTVCGNIEINASGIYGVGVIVGYTYGGNLTIKDCKVEGAEGSYINAKSGAGAVVGYANNTHVVDATVSTLNITGDGLLGGLVGISVGSTDINGATVSNVVLNATNELWVNATGVAVGTIVNKTIAITGVVSENVTGADTIVGSEYAEKPTTVVPAIVAKVGNKYYTSLEEALSVAVEGDTVYVLAGTYAMPAMKAGITIEGVGSVLFEGTLTGTLKNLTLKNIHIKGGNAQRWAYAEGELVFENVTFEATSVYALHFDGIVEGTTILYKDCTIIGWAAMSGSPASVTFDGCTIKGNGTYGLIRTYFNATIKNCTFDVSNVNTEDVYQDGIHAVNDAVVTVENCTNLNGEMKAIIETSGNSYVVLDGESIHTHKYTAGTAVDPTCTEAGYTPYTCACGHTYNGDEVAALGHTAGAEATCTTAQTCTVCGDELVAALGHTWADATCEAAKTCSVCGATDGEALGHVWENCACTGCDAVLPTLGHNDSFSFSSQDNFDAAVATGKLALVGAFRDNGGSFQFNTDSTIQFVAPANTTVTIVGHSAQYGVFNVYLNGEKTVMEGSLTFTVTEETKVVIAVGDNGASYSYIKSITLAEYVDRTITSDTTINFGSEGNYKDSVVDFSGIQIGDNGGNNSQVKNGSFDLLLKAGSKVVIHGYPGYTSYKLNDGEEIISEWYTYIALEDMVLTVTPVSGNNYFYSIEVTLHTGVTLVEAKSATCTEAGYAEHYACECHGALTDKAEVAALGHTAGAEATCTTAQTCTVCGVVLAEKLAHEWADATCTAPKTCTVCNATEGEALGHKFFAGVCTVCEVADPDYNAYLLNFSQWPEFPKETYADGDIFKYNDIFTFIMSKNSRVDASAKTWEDFEGTLRFSFGGKTPTGAVPSKNALQITVDGAYTIKIWYIAGGDARYFALMNAEGTVLSETTNETVKNGQYYAELVIPAAGTYYFGVPADNNYIFQIELVKHEHTAGAEATCTTAQTCTVCGAELVAALGHDIVVDEAVAPTCTETGLTAGEHCSRCDHKVAQEVVEALGHSYEVAVTAPTCTSIGYTTYTCACGDTYTGDEVAALEHNYENGACTVCGKEDPNYVPHEHNFVEGKCECGEIDPNYVPEQPSVEEPAEELNFFEKIIAWIVEFFNKLIAMFKKN